jgi:hypothetical protein
MAEVREVLDHALGAGAPPVGRTANVAVGGVAVLGKAGDPGNGLIGKAHPDQAMGLLAMKHGEPSTAWYRRRREQLGHRHAPACSVVTPTVIGAHEAAALVNLAER